jgi:leucyl/phenylalanyl-tRNA--protein transferase
VINSRVVWLAAKDPPSSFPSVSRALQEPDGLLAAGGDLSPERLLYAYSHGIFPWYEDGQPLLWWSPDPRCAFLPGDYHVSRRLRRELLGADVEVRVNTAFAEVVRGCAAPRRSEQGTWITPDMIAAYQHLHELGWAHSIEIWQADKLIGGLYGLTIGKIFFGESMFSICSNASKIALLYLARRLQAGDFDILDCQVVSSHLLGLGARIIPRSDFIEALESACGDPVPYSGWPDDPTPCPYLVTE